MYRYGNRKENGPQTNKLSQQASTNSISIYTLHFDTKYALAIYAIYTHSKDLFAALKAYISIMSSTLIFSKVNNHFLPQQQSRAGMLLTLLLFFVFVPKLITALICTINHK